MDDRYNPIDTYDQWSWYKSKPKQGAQMKKIYIGSNYASEPFALILAENKEIADAFFLGMNQNHSSTEELDPADENLGMIGIVTVLTSTEKSMGHCQTPRKYKEWKRGM